MSAHEAQLKIEEYLSELRSRLRGLGERQVSEIIAELRSHIAERAAPGGELTVDGVSAALRALGSSAELARQYAADEVLAAVEISRSPLRLLDSLFAWATMSVAGSLVLMGAITGYFLGLIFLAVAFLKPFHPATAGLWALRDGTGDPQFSLRMGFGAAPSNGQEVLGWWIVPLGILLGCGLVMLTSRFSIWCVRMYRRSRARLRPA